MCLRAPHPRPPVVKRLTSSPPCAAPRLAGGRRSWCRPSTVSLTRATPKTPAARSACARRWGRYHHAFRLGSHRSPPSMTGSEVPSRRLRSRPRATTATAISSWRRSSPCCCARTSSGRRRAARYGGFVIFGAGNLFFPISYIFGDVLTEVYGFARARKVIWAGFGAMIFATIMGQVIIHLPPEPPRAVQRA